MMKLNLLKIIIFDIFISLGDTVTDILQGIDLLTLDHDDSTGPAGFAITRIWAVIFVSTKWFPVLISVAHLWACQDTSFLNGRSPFTKATILVVIILMFPLVPTLLFFQIFWSSRYTDAERRKLKRRERKAFEVRCITAAVETPIQVFILLYFMLRGLLPLPWNETVSSYCILDYLDRPLCLPSTPLASFIFSFLSIMKAMYYFNIYPLLVDQEYSMDGLRYCLELFVGFTPFFLINVIFRVFSFAYILIYFGTNLFIVPVLILVILNYAIFSICFTKYHTSTEPSNQELKKLESIPLSMQIPRPKDLDLSGRNMKKKKHISFVGKPDIISQCSTNPS